MQAPQLFIRFLITGQLFLLLIYALQRVDAGGNKGNKGGSDIILYKDNLVIRDSGGKGGKGKGKGGGGGTLVIASGHHEKHHHDLGHHEFGHEGFGHHGGSEDKYFSQMLMGMGKNQRSMGARSSNSGGGNNNNMKKTKDMTWEQYVMGGQP